MLSYGTVSRKISFFVILICCLSANAFAAMHTETVQYKDGSVVLEGYLVYDDSFITPAGVIKGPVPGVVIFHDWMGAGPYVLKRAEEIAKLGYVAFAADIYGRNMRPKDAKEAASQAAIYRGDRRLMRERANAGLEELKSHGFVDKGRIAAMGYCFGGGVALELARSGANITGVVSFHGNLDTPHPEDAKHIKAKVLVCHGADDPLVATEQVLAFQKEMRAARVDWQMNIYGNAVHGFTNPGSGDDPSSGLAYNKEADTRSWQAMKDFFAEVFSRKIVK